MPTKNMDKSIPPFKTEKQERDDWESNDSTAHVDWRGAARVVMPHLKPSTQSISLRLPQHLLDGIKQAANSRDVPYQSLIKMWLHEKLGFMTPSASMHRTA
jgi:predicted DNA binding CopG/RHH family protein